MWYKRGWVQARYASPRPVGDPGGSSLAWLSKGGREAAREGAREESVSLGRNWGGEKGEGGIRDEP
jgi:hypothetical protein